MRWIESTDLKQWANTFYSKFVLQDILRLPVRDFHKLIDPLMIKKFNNYEEIMNYKNEKDVPSELREGFQFWLNKEENGTARCLALHRHGHTCEEAAVGGGGRTSA